MLSSIILIMSVIQEFPQIIEAQKMKNNFGKIHDN